MGFLSKLFGQKQDTPKPDFSFYTTVVDAITISENLKTILKTSLQQAFENPQSFYNDDNDFILSERGLTYPNDKSLTAKFVLVDTLIDNNQMSEVDWKEREEEIRFAINGILKAKNYPFQLSHEDTYDEDLDTSEILEAINEKELKPAGYALEILDINSDSYVFTIVPINLQPQVAAMFAKLA